MGMKPPKFEAQKTLAPQLVSGPKAVDEYYPGTNLVSAPCEVPEDAKVVGGGVLVSGTGTVQKPG